LAYNGNPKINLNPFEVNSFWTLGIADPFPDEGTFLAKETHLVEK
jgi:hypothetical protein